MTRHHTQAMRAIILHTHGGPEQLVPAEIPDPDAAPGRGGGRPLAAALNRRDVWQRGATGNDGAVLGSDGAGRVSALGSDVTGIAVGDEVVINPSVGWGDARGRARPTDGRSWASPARAPTPSGSRSRPTTCGRGRSALTWHESAALPLAGLTAWRALVTRGGVQPGHARAGHRRRGRRRHLPGPDRHAPTAPRSPSPRPATTRSTRAIELGAARGVRYTDPGWPAQVGEVDLAVDSAGAPAWPGALDCLRRGGTLVSFGRTGGVIHGARDPAAVLRPVEHAGHDHGQPPRVRRAAGARRQAPAGGRSWTACTRWTTRRPAHARLEQPDRFGKVVLECRST